MCTVSLILIKSIYPLLRHRASFTIFYPLAARITQVTGPNLTHSTYFVNLASKISCCQEKLQEFYAFSKKNAHLSPLKNLKNKFCTHKSTQNSKLLQKIRTCFHIIAGIPLGVSVPATRLRHQQSSVNFPRIGQSGVHMLFKLPSKPFQLVILALLVTCQLAVLLHILWLENSVLFPKSAFSPVPRQRLLQLPQTHQHQNCNQSRYSRQQVQARPAGHTYTCNKPDCCRSS